MHSTRFFICLVAGLFLSVATGSSVNRAPSVEPVLRLEKPRYVLGEAIRFWVGVMPKNSTVIPEELRRPCSLSITKPDGAQRVESVGWPKDGMLDHGWRGGWGFGNEKVESGRYILVLECAGERTPPVELIVERNDIFDQVKVELRFEREGVVTKATQVPVVLTVQNGSEATIQFPHRAAMMEGASLRIVRKEPSFHSDLFFPREEPSHSKVTPDTYTWDLVSEAASVLLQPGEYYEHHALLDGAYSFDRDGDYEITITTALSVLVGEKNGRFADLCPIRFPVTATAKFVLSSSEHNAPG